MNAMAELAGSFGPTNDPFQASIITREAMQEIILYAIDKAGFSDNVRVCNEINVEISHYVYSIP